MSTGLNAKLINTFITDVGPEGWFSSIKSIKCGNRLIVIVFLLIRGSVIGNCFQWCIKSIKLQSYRKSLQDIRGYDWNIKGILSSWGLDNFNNICWSCIWNPYCNEMFFSIQQRTELSTSSTNRHRETWSLLEKINTLPASRGWSFGICEILLVGCVWNEMFFFAFLFFIDDNTHQDRYLF